MQSVQRTAGERFGERIAGTEELRCLRRLLGESRFGCVIKRLSGRGRIDAAGGRLNRYNIRWDKGTVVGEKGRNHECIAV